METDELLLERAAWWQGRLKPHEHQPTSVDLYFADGLCVKRTVFAHAGAMAPQHSHTWDHLSLIAAGAVRCWAGDQDLGVFRAPKGVVIKAGVKHMFQILVDGTIIDCIHNIERAGEIEVAEPHEVV